MKTPKYMNKVLERYTFKSYLNIISVIMLLDIINHALQQNLIHISPRLSQLYNEFPASGNILNHFGQVAV